jgi:hypothetical protein
VVKPVKLGGLKRVNPERCLHDGRSSPVLEQGLAAQGHCPSVLPEVEVFVLPATHPLEGHLVRTSILLAFHVVLGFELGACAC